VYSCHQKETGNAYTNTTPHFRRRVYRLLRTLPQHIQATYAANVI